MKGREARLNILLIEDNEQIAKGLSYSFEKNKLDMIHKKTVKEAKEYILSGRGIDIIILDISLPDGNGFDLYTEIIKERNIPTIFLTARDDENDIVKGLELGAEDYVTKPFGTKELIARINKVSTRTKRQRTVKTGNVTFDPDRPELCRGGVPVDLTPLEMKIITLLFANINTAVSRSILLDKVWDWTGNFVDDHTITVYLNRIRDKVGPDVITTIKGVGYRIDEK